MRNILIIIFLFIKTSCFSQDIESIKKLDTVYIYFNHMKYEKYSNIGGTSNKRTIDSYVYQFYLNNDYCVNFISTNYKDFDDLEKGIKTDVKTVKKKFLRKNKEKILDINFFIKNGFLETFNAIYVPHKVIYLIDSREINGRKVLLKEVLMSAPNFTPE